MTHAQAVLLITPLSTALIALALGILLWQLLPPKPQPVYFANGTCDMLARAMAEMRPVGHRIGLFDPEGCPVIGGQTYLHPHKHLAGYDIVAIPGGQYKRVE